MAIPVGGAGHNKDAVVAPVFEVGRKANPHMRLAPDNGSVNQGESAFESSREKAGVLVLGRQQRPKPGKGLEILCNGKRDHGAAFAKRGIGDRILLLLLQPDNARVFDSPSFLPRIVVGLERRRRVNLPFGQAVVTAGNGQVRKAPHILASNQQKRLVVYPDGAGIKNSVDGIRPVVRR